MSNPESPRASAQAALIAVSSAMQVLSYEARSSEFISRGIRGVGQLQNKSDGRFMDCRILLAPQLHNHQPPLHPHHLQPQTGFRSPPFPADAFWQ